MKYFNVFVILMLMVLGCNKENSNPIEPNSTTPFVKIIAPENNANVIDAVSIDVTATDDKGIVKVEILIDNLVAKTFAVAPFRYLWDISTLTDSTTHAIYAKAYDGDDNVSSSSVITVTIYMLAPPNIKSVNLTDNLVSLSWNDNSKIETSFVVEMSTDSINYSPIGEFPSNTTSAIINYVFGFDCNYFFRVGAKNGKSIKYSIVAVANRKLAPSNLKIVDFTYQLISLSWNDNSKIETSFVVEMSTDSINYSPIGEFPSNTVQAVVNYSFIFGQKYFFRVGAKSVVTIKYTNIVSIDSPEHIVGIWISAGANIAPLLNVIFAGSGGIDTIWATFNTNKSYLMKQKNVDGTVINYSGTYTSNKSSVGSIYTITANQSTPAVSVSEGIYEIDRTQVPQFMRYEVVLTSGTQNTPPTPTLGFGSTNGGAFGMMNVQKYVRVQ
ncbi:MAG: hypothetical protein K8H86_09335 [Ignavibacteriaceae bacterium]|nr:hypothetical protein [Ignavibacteriaceae bacterium]